LGGVVYLQVNYSISVRICQAVLGKKFAVLCCHFAQKKVPGVVYFVNASRRVGWREAEKGGGSSSSSSVSVLRTLSNQLPSSQQLQAATLAREQLKLWKHLSHW
jgi:hypothetical protein